MKHTLHGHQYLKWHIQMQTNGLFGNYKLGNLLLCIGDEPLVGRDVAVLVVMRSMESEVSSKNCISRALSLVLTRWLFFDTCMRQ